MVMKLANIFGWDIDFVLDIRAGDRFNLIYEKLYRDGRVFLTRWCRSWRATFINQGEKFQAIRLRSRQRRRSITAHRRQAYAQGVSASAAKFFIYQFKL